jgi:hypothetical protein
MARAKRVNDRREDAQGIEEQAPNVAIQVWEKPRYLLQPSVDLPVNW